MSTDDDIDRSNPDDAARVFQALLQPHSVVTTARLLARAIQLAHAAGPDSWSISLFEKMVRLNVGQVEVCTLRRQSLRLITCPPKGRSAGKAYVFESSGTPVFPAVPVPSGIIDIDALDIGSMPLAIVQAHDDFIRLAAQHKQRSPFRRAYSVGVLLFLEAVLASELPRPGYLPELDTAKSAGTAVGGGADEASTTTSAEPSASSVGPTAPGTPAASFASRLRLPASSAARMRAIAATSAGIISGARPDWYHAQFDRPSHLRVAFGRLIVLTLEADYVWLALDEAALGSHTLRSWRWDEPDTRPDGAKGRAYPRFRRPPSRNGYYDPSKDSDGREWKRIEFAHHLYLGRVAAEGVAPDHRTVSDPSLLGEILTWGAAVAPEVIFDLAVRSSLRSSPEARRERLARAPRKPPIRAVNIQVFVRNADVVAEVLIRAGGRCELCKEPAPFVRAGDGTPYLEVHHTVRLADGGDDSVDNAVAACPNCHRRAHFG